MAAFLMLCFGRNMRCFLSSFLLYFAKNGHTLPYFTGGLP